MTCMMFPQSLTNPTSANSYKISSGINNKPMTPNLMNLTHPHYQSCPHYPTRFSYTPLLLQPSMHWAICLESVVCIQIVSMLLLLGAMALVDMIACLSTLICCSQVCMGCATITFFVARSVIVWLFASIGVSRLCPVLMKFNWKAFLTVQHVTDFHRFQFQLVDAVNCCNSSSNKSIIYWLHRGSLCMFMSVPCHISPNIIHLSMKKYWKILKNSK